MAMAVGDNSPSRQKLKLASLLLAACCSIAGPVPAFAKKQQATPKELAVPLVAKKRAEISTLRVGEELRWFGLQLLGPIPAARATGTSKGTDLQIVTAHGVWDEVHVESAGGAIVGLTFFKRFDSLYDADAFQASLREHVSERLGTARVPEVYKGYSWPLATEAKYLEDWEDYLTCKIALARDPGNPLATVLCTEEPRRTRIAVHLSSAFIERTTSNSIKFVVSTVERGQAIDREREKKKQNFRRQLEEGDGAPAE